MKLLRDKIKRDTFMCKKLCNMIARGDLREDHPQQRRSGIWKNEDRDNFIVTVLLNEDFDPLKICEQLTENGVVLWLIDGLQRSTTIKDFKSGKFALGKKIDPCCIDYQEAEKNDKGEIMKTEDGDIIYKNVSFDLRGKSYVDLPEKLKEDFDNCPIWIVKHLNCSDKEVSRHIVRYNSGRPMVAAQKIVTYMDNTAKYVKKLAGHAFFNDCANYSETSDKNGTVDKVVCEAIMGLNFFDVWTKDAKKIGSFLNNNATKEMFDNFAKYLDRLLNIITPEMGKLFSQKNALIWFMLFDKFAKSGLNDEEFGTFLEHFKDLKDIKMEVSHEYKLVKGSEVYSKELSFAELNGCNSTKDKGIIVDKLHILEKLMNDFLHINEETKEVEIDSSKEMVADIGEEETVIDFVRENVKTDVDEEDVDLYYEMLDKDYDIDKTSKLLDWQNEPSLIAIIAYSFEHDIELNDWIKDFFSRNSEYIKDQKENYIHMKADLQKFFRKVGGWFEEN